MKTGKENCLRDADAWFAGDCEDRTKEKRGAQPAQQAECKTRKEKKGEVTEKKTEKVGGGKRAGEKGFKY